jgi:hypothetical protein
MRDGYRTLTDVSGPNAAGNSLMLPHQMHHHHHGLWSMTMRTTLDIDGDVLEAAKAIGRRTHRTVGAVLCEQVRRALTTSFHRDLRKAETGTEGFMPCASRGGIVTNELIDRLREGDAY